MSISVASRPAIAVGVVVHPLAIFWQISPGKETIQNLREAIPSWDQSQSGFFPPVLPFLPLSSPPGGAPVVLLPLPGSISLHVLCLSVRDTVVTVVKAGSEAQGSSAEFNFG